MSEREGINELLVQRAKYLIETQQLLNDPVLVLAKRIEALTWVIAATAIAQVALHLR